jgi:hypothetical protein
MDGLKVMKPFDPYGGPLRRKGDDAGGYGDTGPMGKKVPLSKGQGNASMKPIDPKGGKLVGGSDNSGGFMQQGA